MQNAWRSMWEQSRGFVAAVGIGVLSAALVAGGVAVTGNSEAEAKASYESLYGFDRTWNAATRLLRVDLGFTVLERDESTGYVLFEYKSPERPKPTHGSFEFIGGREPGQPVLVAVQLPEMPRYHEQNLADQLARKLRTEFGDPPRPRPRKAPDADAGASED